MLGRRNSGAANPGYALYINMYDSTDGRILFGTEGAVAYSEDPAIVWDEWQHVALTWGESDLRLCLHGDEVSATGPVSLTGGMVNARLGGMTFTDYFFQGQMDEFRIWSTNRSEDDIHEYMGRTIATNTQCLTACYRFDHAIGTQLEDVADAGHDGMLVNMTDAAWPASTAPLAYFTFETNDASWFRITDISNGPPVNICFNALFHRFYTLIGCSNLAEEGWTNVPGAGPKQGLGGSDQFSDTYDSSSLLFYRLEVELPMK